MTQDLLPEYRQAQKGTEAILFKGNPEVDLQSQEAFVLVLECQDVTGEDKSNSTIADLVQTLDNICCDEWCP